MVKDYRQASEHDCDRLLYSDEFRRLGGVTQVLAVGEAPLFHNRMTHTLKVQQLARRIAEHADRDARAKGLRLEINPGAAEAAGLAHDFGHPPFGHVGETALSAFCKEGGLDGFEGNAQTFRILTKIGHHTGFTFGFGLSDETLAGVIKYPWMKAGVNHSADKWNAYPTEEEIFTRVVRKAKDGRTYLKSVEAEIMDLADDITYAVHDLQDFIRSGHVPIASLAEGKDAPEFDEFFAAAKKHLQNKKSYEGVDWDQLRDIFWDSFVVLFAQLRLEPQGIDRQRSISSACSTLIGQLVDAVEVDTLAGTICLPVEVRCIVEIYKRFTWHYVINDPRLATLQAGYEVLLQSLCRTLLNLVNREGDNGSEFRIPPRLRRLVKLTENEPGAAAYSSEKQRFHRAVADYVAGLTEFQAIELAGRLNGVSTVSALDPWLNY